MDGSIELSVTDQKALFEVDWRETDTQHRLRASILLLRGDGVARAVIVEVLDTRTATINRWRKPYPEEGTNCIVLHRGTALLADLGAGGVAGRGLHLPDRNGPTRIYA